ncbi:hypothetical protein [Pectobacterium brasiliense]|uniref:hypothetical protein n=1 Tax=Pectobacterium brasiliense TaxID=180957 RepID=UPI000D3FC915|nr:hypothetical protein [Pectobacterium brasiliense]PPE57088.1 hypothetical protein F152LOC_04136 [Pectobacterium brasiliense]
MAYDREQLMTALRNADAAGDTEGATRIAQMIQSQGQQTQKVRDPSFTDSAEQAARGLANIPFDILQGGANLINAGTSAVGLGNVLDPVYRPVDRPTDPWAQAGEAIGTYLVPGAGAVRGAMIGSVANAGNQPGDFAENATKEMAINTALMGVPALYRGAKQLVRPSRAAAPAEGGAGAAGESIAQRMDGSVAEEASSLRNPAMESAPESVGVSAPAQEAVAARYGKAAESGDKGRIAQVINDIQPDQQVIDASKRLGIEPDSLLEAYTSGNEAFKALQIGLASQDASVLSAIKRESIERISRRASKIIDDAGAMADRLEVNNKFRSDFDTTRKALVKQENELFQPVNDAIPVRAAVDPKNTRAYLDNLADDLGGAEHLSTVEKWVYDKIAPAGSDAGAPTYARLNAARARVGADLNKAGTPFGSAEERNLSQLYANLSRDRDAVADAYGFTDQIKAANAVTVQRKIMEERVYNLLGKDMTGDVTAAANTALNGLSTGNSQKFRQLMRSIPDKEMRKQVIATGMRDMLRKGTRSDLADNINGFVDYYGALKRNGNVKMLASVLPKGSMQRMEDFYTLARNVKSANRYHLQTGKLSSFLQSFEQPNGFLDKLATHGKMATIATVLGQVPVVGPVLNTSIAAQMGAKAATKKTGAQAVQDLMVSSEWKRLSAAARGNPSPSAQQKIVQGADGRISRTEAWKEFYRTLPRTEKESIARLGIIGWLSGDSGEQQ